MNPLLLALPTSRPIYYDLFIILHVYVLLIGTYFLVRWYARPELAAVVSMLTAFSGITFLHFNAIHYRSLVWLPWMMAGIIGVLRGERIRRHWLMLLFATIACGTAGNVQEFALDTFAACVVAVCEWAALKHGRLRGAALAVTALTLGTVIASVSFIPFFVGHAQGWIFIPVDGFRSTQPYDPAWLFSWLIPKVTGPYPHLFLQAPAFHPHPDYSLFGCMLLVLGAIAGGIAWRSGDRRSTFLTIVPIIVIIVGLLKIIHLPVFAFITWIPFVRDLWFVKYHSYLFVLAAIPSGIGLEKIWTTALADRRRIAATAFSVTLAVLFAAMVYLRLKPSYSVIWDMPAPFMNDVLLKWAVSVAVFLCSSAILLFLPRRKSALLLGLITVQCMVMIPRGYGKRRDVYGPVNYAQGTTPHQRLLVSDLANSNLLFDREALGVTDSVTNRYFRLFLWNFFPVINAGTMVHPILKEPINDTQALALRAVGVERVIGFNHNTPFINLEGRVANPLPRAFLISRTTFDAVKGTDINTVTVADLVSKLEHDLAIIPQPAATRIEDETIRFNLPSRSSPTILVLNQAYSPNWKLNGRRPVLMADLWPAWELAPGGTSTAAAVYWPEGLTTGMGVSAVGAVAAMFCWAMIRKENR